MGHLEKRCVGDHFKMGEIRGKLLSVVCSGVNNPDSTLIQVSVQKKKKNGSVTVTRTDNCALICPLHEVSNEIILLTKSHAFMSVLVFKLPLQSFLKILPEYSIKYY